MPELFETFDDAGNLLGLVPRDEVHRLGLWHRSCHVFVFSQGGELLLQRRASNKDLYADLWDYSVGEHLTPGESFADGARRGVQEELGVDAEPVPVGQVFRECFETEGIRDCEIQQAFVLKYEGPFQIDPVEVAEIRFLSLAEVWRWIKRNPEAFTPWFPPQLKRLAESGVIDR